MITFFVLVQILCFLFPLFSVLQFLSIHPLQQRVALLTSNLLIILLRFLCSLQSPMTSHLQLFSNRLSDRYTTFVCIILSLNFYFPAFSICSDHAIICQSYLITSNVYFLLQKCLFLSNFRLERPLRTFTTFGTIWKLGTKSVMTPNTCS